MAWTVSSMVATSMGQPISSIRCIVRLASAPVVKRQGVIGPGLCPAHVIDAVGEKARLLVDKQPGFGHIHQLDGAPYHLIAKCPVRLAATHLQQGEDRKSVV